MIAEYGELFQSVFGNLVSVFKIYNKNGKVTRFVMCINKRNTGKQPVKLWKMRKNRRINLAAAVTEMKFCPSTWKSENDIIVIRKNRKHR